MKDDKKQVNITLTEAELQKIRVAAAKQGLSPNRFIAQTAIKAAEPTKGKKK